MPGKRYWHLLKTARSPDRETARLSFALASATVLDCANGEQKEKQNEIEEKYRPEGDAGKEAGAEADNC
jgi:hypothetical protein